MVDEIKFKKTKKIKLFIDGIEFDKPKDFQGFLFVGLCGVFILVSLPLWIWFYLFGKVFTMVARKEEVDTMIHFCPMCGDVIKYYGSLHRIECGTCEWSGYLDCISKKDEVK